MKRQSRAIDVPLPVSLTLFVSLLARSIGRIGFVFIKIMRQKEPGEERLRGRSKRTSILRGKGLAHRRTERT